MSFENGMHRRNLRCYDYDGHFIPRVPWLAHLFWELLGLSLPPLAGSPELLSLTFGQFPGRTLSLSHLPLQLTLFSPVFGLPGPTSDPRVCGHGAWREVLTSFFFLGSGSSQGFWISHSGRGRPSNRPAVEAKWRQVELGFEPRLLPHPPVLLVMGSETVSFSLLLRS